MTFWCQSCGDQHTQPHVTSANITTCARCGGSHFATWKPVRQSLSQEAVRDEALAKILDRRCTNPKLVGDSACDCCQHHWFAILGHTPIEEYRALKREPNAAVKIGQSYEVMGIEQANDWARPTTAKLGASSAAPFPIYRVEDEVRASSCPDPQACKRANRCLNEPPCGKFTAMTGASDD